jgi:glycine/D-amino acid oxidase-like deaminating enzyme
VDDIDVLIIGGGVGGLSCAMTISSAGPRPWFGDRRVLVIDDGGSDLNKARLFNAPGIVPGTTGVQTLENLRAQLGQYPAATLVAGRVVRVERDGDRWAVATNSGDSYTCETIVLATGYKCCDIEALPVSPVPHPRGGKADRIMFEHDDVYHVAPNLHVAGLLGGGSSQFAIAAGIGVQVAVEILSGWAGKRTHVHDVPEPPQ